MEMTRKVVLTGLMIFWAPGTVQQLLLGSTISSVYMSVAIWKQPYDVTFNNRFKIVTDASVVLTFNIAVLLHPGVTEGDDEASSLLFVDKAYLWVTLFAINLGIPAALLTYEVWQYYANSRTASTKADSSQSETQQQMATSLPKHKGKQDMDTFENPLSVDH